MQDLVNQAHGVDLPGLDRLFGETDQVAVVVDFGGETTYGVKIGEDHVAGKTEERFIESVSVPGFTGYVKFVNRLIGWNHEESRLSEKVSGLRPVVSKIGMIQVQIKLKKSKTAGWMSRIRSVKHGLWL